MSMSLEAMKNSLRPLYGPPKTVLSAAFKYYFEPASREPHGGPLNNQAHRRAMAEEILGLITFETVIETGSFYGSSTDFFNKRFGRMVHSVEINDYFYWYNRVRFLTEKKVRNWHASSVDFLQRISADRAFTEVPTFFYLDAHWYDYLPLRDELELVLSHWPQHVVMIDDFRVEDDPGYLYDDYGPDKQLSLDYLAPLKAHDFSLFFPALPAAQETGKKRGSLVLTKTPAYAEALRAAKTLRFYGRSVDVLAAQGQAEEPPQ